MVFPPVDIVLTPCQVPQVADGDATDARFIGGVLGGKCRLRFFGGNTDNLAVFFHRSNRKNAKKKQHQPFQGIIFVGGWQLKYFF